MTALRVDVPLPHVPAAGAPQSVEGRAAWSLHLAAVRHAVGEPAAAAALAREALSQLYGGGGAGPDDPAVEDIPHAGRRLAAAALFNLAVFQVARAAGR